jgi:transketolase N-terminal domain/subunit
MRLYSPEAALDFSVSWRRYFAVVQDLVVNQPDQLPCRVSVTEVLDSDSMLATNFVR